jgi:hypothetical protein
VVRIFMVAGAAGFFRVVPVDFSSGGPPSMRHGQMRHPSAVGPGILVFSDWKQVHHKHSHGDLTFVCFPDPGFLIALNFTDNGERTVNDWHPFDVLETWVTHY